MAVKFYRDLDRIPSNILIMYGAAHTFLARSNVIWIGLSNSCLECLNYAWGLPTHFWLDRMSHESDSWTVAWNVWIKHGGCPHISGSIERHMNRTLKRLAGMSELCMGVAHTFLARSNVTWIGLSNGCMECLNNAWVLPTHFWLGRMSHESDSQTVGWNVWIMHRGCPHISGSVECHMNRTLERFANIWVDVEGRPIHRIWLS